MSSQAPLLYERVARLVESQISSGTLRANERIPSVRAMSRTARVSVSTVVQAYVHLENIGLIEARPQSGFYVRTPELKRLPEPRPKPARMHRPGGQRIQMGSGLRSPLGQVGRASHRTQAR